MKIAVLGAGHIGGTLGTKWARAGNTIRFGVRDLNKPEIQSLVKSLGANATVSSIAEAIDFGDVVVFALPGPVMDETITANAKALDGKIIVDSANKIGSAHPDSMATFVSQTPNARVYRAFNSYAWENLDNPTFNNIRADLFYCGPDGESRTVIEKLIAEVGLDPMYLGGPEQVDLVDNILRLWFTLSNGQKLGRHFAFKVLKR